MSSSNFSYYPPAKRRLTAVRQGVLESAFYEKLDSLRYTAVADTRDYATLEMNFQEESESLNRVHLPDSGVSRLFEKTITPALFIAACTPHERNTFIIDDGTPLNCSTIR